MDLIKREDAIKAVEKWAVNLGNPKMLVREDAILALKDIPSVEPNLILPERMERGECYEVGETIVVLNHDDYYDLLCKAMENKPKRKEQTMNNIDRHPECHMRTALGNCDPIGGFCTSVNKPICEALHKVSRPQGEWILEKE